MEENFPKLKKGMPINLPAYRARSRLDQKKKILPLHNKQNTKCTEQRKNIKGCKRKTDFLERL